MTETTARIRWEELLGGNFEGYVGSVTAPMFEVHRTSGRGATQPWALRSDLLEGYSTGTHPDEMKAEAERWLAGFVSSLGAVFPEPASEFEEDGEPVEVRWAAGRRVRYAHADAGYPGEQEHIAASLSLGEVCAIGWADIGQSRTDLNLFRDGKPAGRFNSVFFEPADDEAAPEAGKDQS